MLRETIAKIEKRIETGPAMKEETRQELKSLLHTLREEVEQLASTHDEEAQSITRFTDLSTHEATRTGKDPKLMQLSLDGLSASVEGFERSHPKLVELVNRICMTLANLGV
jgi:hypothetical protein